MFFRVLHCEAVVLAQGGCTHGSHQARQSRLEDPSTLPRKASDTRSHRSGQEQSPGSGPCS